MGSLEQPGRQVSIGNVVPLLRPCDWSILLWDLGQSISRYLCSAFFGPRILLTQQDTTGKSKVLEGSQGEKQIVKSRLTWHFTLFNFRSTAHHLGLHLSLYYSQASQSMVFSLWHLSLVSGLFPQPQLFSLLLSPQVSLAKLTGGFPAVKSLTTHSLPTLIKSPAGVPMWAISSLEI